MAMRSLKITLQNEAREIYLEIDAKKRQATEVSHMLSNAKPNNKSYYSERLQALRLHVSVLMKQVDIVNETINRIQQ